MLLFQACYIKSMILCDGFLQSALGLWEIYGATVLIMVEIVLGVVVGVVSIFLSVPRQKLWCKDRL